MARGERRIVILAQYLAEAVAAHRIVIGPDQQGQVRRELEQGLPATGPVALERIDLVRRADILDQIAVSPVICARETQRQQIADRQVDHRVGLKRIVIAVADVAGRLEMIRWSVGDDVDQAGGGVAAVKRALRPPQHLDARDVVETHLLRLRPGKIDAVEQEGGGGVTFFGIVAGGYTANGDLKPVVADDRQARHLIVEPRGVGDTGIAQGIAVDS